MDRVILPTRAARTVRERVEARRAREQMRRARLDRYYANTIHRAGLPQEGPPDIPPPVITPGSYVYSIRPASSMARPKQASSGPLPAALRWLGRLARNCLPFAPEPEQRPSTYRADANQWSPPRYASPMRSITPGHRASGGGIPHPPLGGWGAGRGSGGGWGRQGSVEEDDFGGIAISRHLFEFAAAMVVIAVLGFSLINSSRRPVAAQAAAVETPTPQPAAAPKDTKPVRIMLLGSDRRGEDAGFRTDVMMLLTVDPAKNRVSVLSFPRDLVGKIPGYGDGRINIVMGRGGFELLQQTFQDSYGVRPDYYFLINFDGFVGLVNSIGGIEVKAQKSLEDSCDLPQSRAGICTIKPGTHAMDGATALWYIRSRKSSSDFDRLRRAQEVAAGIFNKMISMQAIARLPELYVQYTQDVETNMSIPQMAKLLPVAAEVAKDPKKIKRYSISEKMTADWWMPDGARVLLPDYEAVKAFARKVTYTK